MTKYNIHNQGPIKEPTYLKKNKKRSLRRKNNYYKAKRKENITRSIYDCKPLSEEGWHYYNNLHQFSKNKIHCSCPSCADKTSVKKIKGKNISNNFGIKNWPIRDVKRINQMIDDIRDFDLLS